MSIDGDDRRAPGATRIPFEALVEVGGAAGPSFEAQAVDVSEDGIHLRTAYLPDVGQPLTCRFEAGPRDSVLASGEVVWRQEAGRGGEFGVRFTDLDDASARALGRMTRTSDEAPRNPGAKVRLHIDGLGAPMRARVRGSGRTELTVGSELGFLQVGKQLELEDTATGAKRAARIDRVEVEIDPESRVPQLVVALKYDGDEDRISKEITPGPSTIEDEVPVTTDEEDLARLEGAGERVAGHVKGAIARGAAKVGPTFASFAKRAKVTMALIKARRAAGKGDLPIPLRRVTAPAPGGGLHAEGRKVVRASAPDGEEAHDGSPKTGDVKIGRFAVSKRRLTVGGAAAALALVLTLVAAHKSDPVPAPVATNPPPEAPIAAAAAQPPPSPAAVAPEAIPGVGVPGPAATPPPPITPPATVSVGEPGASDDEPADRPAHKKVAHVQPFSNGPVSHGNVLRLKMDGAIEKIEGASSPTGFTVVVPDRRSLEPAGPLASRDGRIASIKVANDGAGAELSLTFKDGVPNYLVRAKGDTLEVVLAPLGSLVAQRPLPRADGASSTKKAPRRPHNKR